MSLGYSEVPGIFDCPKCKQTIDASAVSCRFCGAHIDSDIALKSAALLAKANQAISEASFMRTVAFSLPVFFVLRFVPLISMLGELGFVGITIVLPIWGVVWWFRYNALEYDDAEFKKARRTVLIATIVVAAVFVLFVILPLGIGFVIGFSRVLHH
jgi:Ca2+/Na+ antiporter